jgi:hypothetical protein
VSRLEPTMSGKSYLQNDKKTTKKVAFAEDKLKQLEYCHNLVSQVKPSEEQTIDYGSNQAMLIARFIQDITRNVNELGASFAQQYISKKGLKVFGNKGHEASKKEINQLHRRTCFAPLKVKEMKPSERKKAQMALMFLTEKRDKSVKGRSIQRKANKRMAIARGCGKPDGGTREHHNYRSDQSKRRERRDDMRHTERFHLSITTKERSGRR